MIFTKVPLDDEDEDEDGKCEHTSTYLSNFEKPPSPVLFDIEVVPLALYVEGFGCQFLYPCQREERKENRTENFQISIMDVINHSIASHFKFM